MVDGRCGAGAVEVTAGTDATYSTTGADAVTYSLTGAGAA